VHEDGLDLIVCRVSDKHGPGTVNAGLLKEKRIAEFPSSFLYRLPLRNRAGGNVRLSQDKWRAERSGELRDLPRFRLRLGPQPMIEVRDHQRLMQLVERMQQAETIRAAGNPNEDHVSGLNGRLLTKAALNFREHE
jgi:hypothetical protein